MGCTIRGGPEVPWVNIAIRTGPRVGDNKLIPISQ